MVGKNFSNEDLVWAKMKGYPHWPAIIITPEAGTVTKKMQHFVRFFGTGDHAWVHDDLIEPHSEDMLNKGLAKKSNTGYQNAIKDMQKHIETAVDRRENAPAADAKEAETPKTPSKVEPSSTAEPKVKSTSVKKKVVKRVPKKSTSGDSKRSSSDAVDDEFSQLLSNLPKRRASGELSGHSPSKRSKQKANDYDLNQPTNSDPIRHITVVSSTEPLPPVLPATSALVRSEYIDRPPTPELDIAAVSDTWSNRIKENKANVKTTEKKIGFLGLGTMGREIVKNLMNSGHDLTLWNRTPEKCKDFEKAGAKVMTTPCDVVAACDITFCCVSDQDVVKTLVLGNWGVLKGMEGTPMGTKGYVELTSISPQVSRELAEAITDKGGRYLEAPIHGNRQMAIEGTLTILGSGDRDLFNECESVFFAMAREAYYLSCTIGEGAMLNLISNQFLANVYAALSESVTMAQNCNISCENLLNVLGISQFHTPIVINKGERMVSNDFGMDTALKHVQKDLHLILEIANTKEQPLLVTAAANEVYKKARRRGYSDHDVSSVSMGTKD